MPATLETATLSFARGSRYDLTCVKPGVCHNELHLNRFLLEPGKLAPEIRKLFIAFTIHPSIDIGDNGIKLFDLVLVKCTDNLNTIRTCKDHCDYVFTGKNTPAGANIGIQITEQ